MAKNPILALIWASKFFLWVLSLLDVKHCRKLLLYTIPRKTNEPNLRKWQKKLISDAIMVHLAQIWATNTFLCGFNLYQMLDIVASYHCM